MKRFYFILSLLICFSIGQMWGDTETYTFTSKSWAATNSVSQTANWTSGKDGGQLTANQGIQITTSYDGANGTSPISFTNVSSVVVRYCTNSTKGAGSIKVQIGTGTEQSFTVTKPSSNGTTLKDATFNFSPVETGKVKVTANCTTNSIYIYSVTINYTAGDSSDPTLSVTPTSLDFGTVAKDANIAAKKFTITGSNLTDSKNITLTSPSGYIVSPTSITPSNGSVSGEVTVTPITTSIGTFNGNITLTSEDLSSDVTVALSMTVEQPFDGLKLSFDFSKNNLNLPISSKTSTAGEYTYTLNNVNYKFSVTDTQGDKDGGIYFSSTYTMIYSGNALGLPAIKDYKLVKVEASNSNSCSTSVNVSIKDGSTSTDNIVTGGAAQTWSTVKSTYTYTLSDTETNTSYYLCVSSKNCQLAGLVLYYEEVAAPAVAKPTISGDVNFLSSTEVSITCTTEGATIYYTTDDTDPKTSGTKQEYSAAFNVTSNTTVRAIATKDAAWSEEATSKTFTKITPITVTAAIAAIPNQDDVLDNQYVSGIVCTAGTSVNASGQMTYYISDDGSETSRLQIYQGKNFNNTAFSAVTDLAIGDRVVVYGQLKNYKGTYEMNSGNYLVSRADPAVAAPVFTPNGGGFMGETDVAISCATANSTIYYTLDGTTPSKFSTPYTAAIHLNATTIIKAIAFVGDDASLVISKTFTLTEPMTVAEALTALDTENPINNAAVIGVISTAPTSNPSSGRLTYYISDDGSTTSELEVYNGFGLNGASFSAKTDLQVGDQVTVFGNLKIFSGSSEDVKEIDAGNRLLAFYRPTVSVIGVSLPETATVRVDKTTTLTATIAPANATDKVVTWKSSNTDIATVADGVVTGVATGTVTITVTTHDGNKTATCEVTVAEAVTFNNSGYEWQHVTSADQLVAGKYYVMASDTKDKVASRTITSGYLGEEPATFADGVIAYNGFGSSNSADESNASVFQLGGNSTDGWTLTEVNEGKVLTGATTANLSWDGTTNTAWPISFDGSDVIIGNSDGNYIRHNYGSNRFKPYSGTQNAMKVPQLYVWAERTLKLRYDANDGENAPSATSAVNGKATVTDAKPTKANQIFNGWNAQADGKGTSYVAGDEITLTDDVTIYAQWRDPAEYSVSYNANGGTLIDGKTAIEDETVTEGTSYTVKENVYEKEGFLFGGWKYDGEVYAKGAKLTIPAGNVELVAKWNALRVTEFVLVTDKDQLLAGDKVYIVASGYDLAAGSFNSSYLEKVNIQKTSDKSHIIIAEGSENEPAEFTLGFSNNNDNITLKLGGKYLASSSAKSVKLQDDSFEWTLTIDANGSTTIDAGTPGTLQYNASSPRFAAYTSDQQPIVLYKKLNTLRPVEAGTWGTFCPEKEVIYPSGASFFTLTYKEMHGEEPYKVFFDEIAEGESLVAGKPYLFIAEGDIKGIEIGAPATNNDNDYNGFHGILNSTKDVTDGKYYLTVTQEDEESYKYYILHGNQIRRCGKGTITLRVGRAYIDMNALTDKYVPAAPGRRRMGVANPDAHSVPTDVDATMSSDKAVKVIINEQMFILRDGKLYDTTGRMVGNL